MKSTIYNHRPKILALIAMIIVISTFSSLLSNPSTATAATTIQVDAVSTVTTSGLSVSKSHTTTGSDLLMLVGVSILNDDEEYVSTVKYNGISLIKEGARANSDDARVEIWKLVGPPTGAHNVVVTFNTNLANYAVVGIITFTGVDQDDALRTFAGNDDDSSSASVDRTLCSRRTGPGRLLLRDVWLGSICGACGSTMEC